MNITFQKGKLEGVFADLLVISEFAGAKKRGQATVALNKAMGGLLEKVLKEERFEGGVGESVVFRTEGKIPARRLLVMGLGERKDFTDDVARNAAAGAAQVAKKFGAAKVAMAVTAAQAEVEGLRLGLYEYVKWKKAPEKKVPEIKEWIFVSENANEIRAAERAAQIGEAYARATAFARDLVNEPAGQMVPAELARVAKKIAGESKGRIKVRVFEAADMRKMKMGGVLGVSQGSEHPPVFVHMQYRGPKAKKRVALVGKAITFDSGGLSLKPADYMMTMKDDMSGAAAVLGAFSALSELAPSVQVDGIFAACENMPSGTAIRPGDVLRARNGKTMEVLNTDAEGRLTLADSLSYACELKPDALVDLATLTGACMVALGEEISGAMGNNVALMKKVLGAAEAAGEKVWELPLEKRYRELIKSEIADMKNIGGKYGGALTAGLFLQEFVTPGTPWVHIDIAGPAFAERPHNNYTRVGGTGAGVRTILQLLSSF